MSVYIHIPFCLQKCHYCVFPVHIIGKSQHNRLHYTEYLQEIYIKALLKEIKTTYQGEVLQTLYLGGGTPSLLSAKNLEKIVDQFKITAQTEITIEGDPTTLTDLQDIKNIGFNRISVGIQSLNDKTLKLLNRSHNYQDIESTISRIINVFGSLRNCSMDMLYNLPSSDSFDDLSRMATQIQPGHVSLYSLQLEEESYFYKQLNYRENQFPLPSNELQYKNYIQVHQLFKHYDHYEISNFALEPSLQSQHNKVYWEGDRDFYGFGMGAASLKDRIRITKPKSLKQYLNYVDNNVGCQIEDENSEFEKQRILLMSRQSILRTKWGIRKCDLKSNVLAELETDKFHKYVESNETHIRLRIPEGYLICDELVGHLQDIE